MSLVKLQWLVAFRVSLAFLVTGCIFFIPAGTIGYWEAWMYMGVIAIPAVSVITYFLRNDPQVIERRMRVKEKETGQKKIMAFASILFVLIYMLPGFDKRYGWSSVPLGITLASDFITLLGYMLFIIVLKTNRYASRIIEVEPGQKVITTGPYSVVRHPMYVGALLIYVFGPLALGSYWAMIASVSLIVVMVIRILNEERVLTKELEGYAEYSRSVRYRLIPGIW
jgi:protein-S-isoprenylcysteine O-methyltransferase Ste14